MKISNKAEYACRTMVELAARFREMAPTRIKTIADTHGIPLRFLVQILLQLKNAGLVLSVRGKSGGYHLARDPENISLAEVLRSVVDLDAKPSLPRKQKGNQPAPSPVPADSSPVALALAGVWREMEAEEQRFLRRISLADLVRRTAEAETLSYQI